MMLEVMENIACLSQRGKLVRTHKRYPQSWATPIEATLTLITLRCSRSPVATSKMGSCFTTSTQCEQIVYPSLNSSPSEHDGCCGSTLWARSRRCSRALAVGLCHGGQDTHVHIAISPRYPRAPISAVPATAVRSSPTERPVRGPESYPAPA